MALFSRPAKSTRLSSTTYDESTVYFAAVVTNMYHASTMIQVFWYKAEWP